MTDDIEALIRDAKPGTAHRTDPVPEAGLRLLEEIRSQPVKHTSVRRRSSAGSTLRKIDVRSRTSIIAATLSAMAVVFAVVVSLLQPSASAQAATPAPLETTAVSESVTELAEELSAMRANDEEPTSADNTIRLNEWSLLSSVNDKGEIVSSSIEPQWRELTLDEAGNVTRFRLIAGEPFPGQDRDGLPEPGTVLEDSFHDANNPFVIEEGPAQNPPTDPAQVGDYLADVIGVEHPTAGLYFGAIESVLSTRIITARQEAALLSFIAQLPDVQLDGSTTDRLGRPGVVFRATDEDDYDYLLVVSPEAGKFLAFERIYVGTERTDITSPSVTSYVAWER